MHICESVYLNIIYKLNPQRACFGHCSVENYLSKCELFGTRIIRKALMHGMKHVKVIPVNKAVHQRTRTHSHTHTHTHGVLVFNNCFLN
jgi:hypothetical protein